MTHTNFSRRNYLKASIGFIGSVSLATLIGLENLATPEAAVGKEISDPDKALQELIAGNQRFMTGKTEHPRQDQAHVQKVAKGQTPFAALLSCADSRVPVEILFDQGFGDLFVVRDAGNIATSEEIGSLEFGTLVLGAKVLMVIGHQSCGAVQATMAGADVPGSIGKIIEQIKPAISGYEGKQDDKESLKKATQANVLFQMERIKASPIISKLIEEKKLKVAGAYYNLDEGKITIFN